MRSSENNNTSPKRQRHSKWRLASGPITRSQRWHHNHHRLTYTQIIGRNDDTFMDPPQQSRTSQAEIMAEMKSMVETLRQYSGWERHQLRTDDPPASNDAASDAEGTNQRKIDRIESDLDSLKELVGRSSLGGIDQKIDCIKNDVDKMKKELAALGTAKEIDQKFNQKIDCFENELNEVKKELAGLNTMRETLAIFQQQLQMLLNAFMLPGQLPLQFPDQTYPSAYPPPPGV
ncbi:hypothetical protein NQ176_g4229 [Zarea fungicola]|uniref:Uncharacterized protein n=1 Tax=Zarea fungicola TaxID=93591 RepID=A0ACC1NF71_9HYPO|nr:hypothetical protein NQ176_g4229 [Lecanicillium fungicola]